MATIYDVAKAVGVSHTAVSAVLNDRPTRVSAATRQRVLEAAELLGYRTNRAAQQLATGRFNTIALCFERPWDGRFLHPIANRLIAGVGDWASEHGLFLLFAPNTPDQEFEQTVSSLSMHGVDGAIVIGSVSLTESTISAIDRNTIPLVCVDSYPNFVSAGTVDQDNRAGMRTGVEHLIANGHRRMAYLGAAAVYQCLADRMAGFREAILNSGLSIDEQTTHVIPCEDVESVVTRALESPNRPTAIVSGEERITMALLYTVEKLGLRIPQDISVLSYGDPALPHALADSISVIRNVPYDMGKTAGELLKKMIDGACPEPVAIRLPPELVLRACTTTRKPC